MGRFIDLTGQRFGRWTVLRYAGSHNGAFWECRCDCGTVRVVRGCSLRYGESKSCGCSRAEATARENTLRKTTHGMSRTRLYSIWANMKYRCSPSCSKHFYDLYYGRGIRVCPEWENDFEAFYRWAMAHGYRDELSIDRIDNDGNYEPSNCRWVTEEVQANNRSTSKFITYNGETLTEKQWAKKLNISYDTIRYNLSKGKTLEDIINKRDL